MSISELLLDWVDFDCFEKVRFSETSGPFTLNKSERSKREERGKLENARQLSCFFV